MKKYFIMSDVHSFYKEMIDALKEKEFDIENPDHIFVLLGDLCDRGKETIKVVNYIQSIPKERRILIRGNHEYLLRDLIQKDFPQSHDFSNGTVRTCCDYIKADYRMLDVYDSYLLNVDPFEYWGKVKKSKRLKKLVDWMFSDEWIDYYELGKLILVHSFIPINRSNDIYKQEFKEDWRNSSREEWGEATWGCPWELYQNKLFDSEARDGKILVCGHWHTSDFYKSLEGYYDKEIEEICPIYYGDHIIAIDACTAYTHRCNVLVVNENGELII